ncbi:MAG TPA: hypothetical protein VNO30_43725 [Kofleriaceae bacterium]|nr:hypothetical protein [Kofleriaceae bacterium]
MVLVPFRWLTLGLSISACDAASSGSTGDAMPPVVDNGNCGDMIRFTGEYVDWDQTASKFCGIFGARFASRDGSGVDNTAPNGRFDLCVPNKPITLVEIGQPTQPSQCSTTPGSYKLPGLAVASTDVFLAGAAWSGRAFVMGRETVDLAKAQVFVHVHGKAREVSIGAAYVRAQARSDSGWQPGATGQDVFFQDVEVGSGETTISAVGAVVPEKIPLAPGTMTNVTILAR